MPELLGLPDARAVGLPRLVLPPELRQDLPEPQVRVALVLIGVALVWSAARLPSFVDHPKLLMGGLLVVRGMFNVAQGIVDHHILQLHYVRAGLNH